MHCNHVMYANLLFKMCYSKGKFSCLKSYYSVLNGYYLLGLYVLKIMYYYHVPFLLLFYTFCPFGLASYLSEHILCVSFIFPSFGFNFLYQSVVKMWMVIF
jgi:hypothetical protein